MEFMVINVQWLEVSLVQTVPQKLPWTFHRLQHLSFIAQTIILKRNFLKRCLLNISGFPFE